MKRSRAQQLRLTDQLLLLLLAAQQQMAPLLPLLAASLAAALLGLLRCLAQPAPPSLAWAQCLVLPLAASAGWLHQPQARQPVLHLHAALRHPLLLLPCLPYCLVDLRLRWVQQHSAPLQLCSLVAAPEPSLHLRPQPAARCAPCLHLHHLMPLWVCEQVVARRQHHQQVAQPMLRHGHGLWFAAQLPEQTCGPWEPMQLCQGPAGHLLR